MLTEDSQKRPKTPTDVTIIIVNFNSGQLLQKCLKALQRQTLQPSAIIIVDNASTDGSFELIQSAVQNCLYLPQKTNLGFAAGNNLAVNRADTEFIALVNPDAFPEPDWLEKFVVAAASYPKVAAFGSRQMVDGATNMVDGIGDAYHFSGLAWRQGYGCTLSPTYLVKREIFSPCAAAAFYRRKVFLDIGGFEEDYFCYFEDVDLGFRLRLAGYHCLYLPECIINHVGSATSGGRHSDFSIYHGHRNLVWTFVKNMPSILFWLLLPIHILLNLVSLIWFICNGKASIILRAKWDALLGLRKMWRKRQQIQKARVVSASEIWRQMNRHILITKIGRRKL